MRDEPGMSEELLLEERDDGRYHLSYGGEEAAVIDAESGDFELEGDFGAADYQIFLEKAEEELEEITGKSYSLAGQVEDYA
ncbi:MAG: hypothetical protein ABEJ66_01780 [Candidatus Nanohaloarchaea archaeon]